MSELKALIDDLVAANRVLANEGIVDAFGHISVRHPDNPERYLLSRSRSPGMVVADDIMEFELDGTPVDGAGRPIYIERPIHGSVFEARPEVQAVVHNHCPEVLPFAITKGGMRPAVHSARRLGERVPVWDIRDKFGDTDLLVTTMEQGRDLSSALGSGKAVIMRGHGATVTGGSIADAVQSSMSLKINAQTIVAAHSLGEVIYLTPGEINASSPGAKSLRGHDRAWEYLVRKAGAG